MKASKPGQILSEKLKEKDRQIDMLLDYIDSFQSTLRCYERLSETQKKYIELQDELIRLYQSHLHFSKR